MHPGCAHSPEQCNESLGTYILELERYDSGGSLQGKTLEDFRRSFQTEIDNCGVVAKVTPIAGESVSDIAIYIMAGLSDEAFARSAGVSEMTPELQSHLLFTATRYGSVETIKHLVDAGLSPRLKDSVGNNAISAVVDSPVPAAGKIEFLVHAGVDPLSPNNVGFTSLDAAVLASDTVAVRKILDSTDQLEERDIEYVHSLAFDC